MQPSLKWPRGSRSRCGLATTTRGLSALLSGLQAYGAYDGRVYVVNIFGSGSLKRETYVVFFVPSPTPESKSVRSTGHIALVS